MKYLLKKDEQDKGVLCDKVNIDGFDYYYIDELILYNPNGGTNGNFVCLSEIISNNEHGIKLGDKQYISPFVKNVGSCGGCRKIIATNNTSIDLPKVVELLDYETKKYSEITEELQRVIGFALGYNKSQETHPFSEEDMIEFANWVQTNYYCVEINIWLKEGNYYTIKELLQIWKEQQPKVIYYEKTIIS